MRRVLVVAIEDNRAILDEDEAHHLVRVLRLRLGDRFLAHDGRRGLLSELAREGSDWFGDIIRPVETRAESNLHVTLAQSLIKKDKFEWVIQKAVELGVSEIVPFISWRTEVLPERESVEHRMNRWRKIIAEAFKQSGRAYLPVLRAPLELGVCLDSAQADLLLVLDEAGDTTLGQALGSGERPIPSCCLWDPRRMGRSGSSSVRGEEGLRVRLGTGYCEPRRRPCGPRHCPVRIG